MPKYGGKQNFSLRVFPEVGEKKKTKKKKKVSENNGQLSSSATTGGACKHAWTKNGILIMIFF